jgi:hydrogenase/urease accessory protein HupE
MTRFGAFLLALVVLAQVALGHEVRPAYLEIDQTSADSYDVVWKVPGLSDKLHLGLEVVMPTDGANLTAPITTRNAASYTTRWTYQRPGGLAGGIIRIGGLELSDIDVLVRMQDLSGQVQNIRLTKAKPLFAVEAAPSQLEVAGTYTRLGVEHILAGVDHLLFVLSLLILVQGTSRLLTTITAFTLAHSITLAGATLGIFSVPGPPIEATIALSIVFVASEILRGYQGHPGLTARFPWVVSFTFGLLHGFGFASALSDVGLPSTAIPVALLFFNVGVELGQLIFVAAVFAFIALFRALPLKLSPWGYRIVPYGIGSVAMFWVIQRVALF